MHRAHREYCFESIPRILFDLFVTEADLAVLIVNIQHYHFQVLTYFGEFGRMVETLHPAEVRYNVPYHRCSRPVRTNTPYGVRFFTRPEWRLPMEYFSLTSVHGSALSCF